MPRLTAIGLVRAFAAVAVASLFIGCAPEKRVLVSDQPQSPPTGPADPRAEIFETNAYQVSQGGRLFTWYGCSKCHGQGAAGDLDLSQGHWRHGGAVDQVYASISQGRQGGMPAYGPTLPPEQLWQVTAYVRQLPKLRPQQRRRQDLDQQAELQDAPPTGAAP